MTEKIKHRSQQQLTETKNDSGASIENYNNVVVKCGNKYLRQAPHAYVY